MTLPTLKHPGVLPPGLHAASLADLESQFVVGAKNYRRDREVIFMALQVWVRRIRQTIGTGRTLLAGSFITDLPSRPSLKLVFFPDNQHAAVQSVKSGLALSVLSVGDVFYMQPDPGGLAGRMNPVGGVLNVFVGDPRMTDLWEAFWSVSWDVPIPGVAEVGLVVLGDTA